MMDDIQKRVEAYVDFLRDQRSQMRNTPSWMIQNPKIHGHLSEAIAYMDGLNAGYDEGVEDCNPCSTVQVDKDGK